MPYISTRAFLKDEDGGDTTVPANSIAFSSFSEALFTGLAPDGGLYLPTEIPYFNSSKLNEFKKRYRESQLSYPELMVEVMHGFMDAEISKADLLKLAQETMERFPATRPHYHPPITSLNGVGDGVGENAYLAELFHGPTLAFKDYALQFLAGLMNYFLKKRTDKVLILGATSGDTGSAAIHAFSRYDNIKIVILHPHNRVSDFQRRQMTTVTDGQVWNLAVEGSFDDCQNLVKSTFSSRGFLPPAYNLTAVNSINWTRILAQICYYFSAWLQLSDGGKTDNAESVNFIVPSGNFGNVFAGYIAKLMGLPVGELKVAVNANDILHRFFTSNDYRVTSLHATHAPSMDISVSSNLERYLYTLMNPYVAKNENTLQLNLDGRAGKAATAVRSLMESLKTTGQFSLAKDKWKETSSTFKSAKIANKATLDVIQKVHERTGILLDPHTAIGVGALDQSSGSSVSASRFGRTAQVVLATAHPVKFMGAIDSAFSGKDKPNVFKAEDHSLIQSYSEKPEQYSVFPNDERRLQEYILAEVVD